MPQSLRGHVQTAVVGLGGGVQDHGAGLRAVHGLSGALADGVERHVAGMIVVDEVTQHAAVREGHCEVLHLLGDTAAGEKCAYTKLSQKREKRIYLKFNWLEPKFTWVLD